MNDLITREQRLANYKSKYLRIARPFVWVGVCFIALIAVNTVMINHATAEVNYKIAHGFLRVH